MPGSSIISLEFDEEKYFNNPILMLQRPQSPQHPHTPILTRPGTADVGTQTNPTTNRAEKFKLRRTYIDLTTTIIAKVVAYTILQKILT